MTLFSRTFYVIVGLMASFRTFGPRHMASKMQMLFSSIRQEDAQYRFDWRMWLPFWVVFSIGFAMAVVVASPGEHNPEGSLIIK